MGNDHESVFKNRSYGNSISSIIVYYSRIRYSGLGTNIISAGFAGQTIYSYDWLLKLLFTILHFGNWISEVEKLHHCFRLEHLGVILRRSTWITTNVMCSTRISGSLWKRNKYTDRTDHDWIKCLELIWCCFYCLCDCLWVNGNISILHRKNLICVLANCRFRVYDKINKRSERLLENFPRFLQIADPIGSCVTRSKVLKAVLFEAQAIHQLGCDSVKNVAKFNAALSIVYFYHMPKV